MIRFHDPRGATGVDNTPYRLTADLTRGGPVRLGFLANGFPDSDVFLQAVEQALLALRNNLTGRHWNKGNASIPASDDMLDEMTGSCQAVIAAYGH